MSETAGKWLALAAFLLLVVVIGAAWWMRHLGNDVDRVRGQVDQVQTEVSVLREFVDEFQQDPSEEERAENDAIAQAVRIVPELRVILCEAFPDATPCVASP